MRERERERWVWQWWGVNLYRELNFPSSLDFISPSFSKLGLFFTWFFTWVVSSFVFSRELLSFYIGKSWKLLHDITSILRSNNYFPIINKDLCYRQLLMRDDCKSLMHCKTHYHQWSTDHQRSTSAWASSSIFHKQSTDFETFWLPLSSNDLKTMCG